MASASGCPNCILSEGELSIHELEIVKRTISNQDVGGIKYIKSMHRYVLENGSQEVDYPDCRKNIFST